MTAQEKAYRSVINRLGVAMLVLFGGMSLYRTAATEILPFVLAGFSPVTAAVVGELSLSLLYSAAFLVPVFVFFGISKGKPHEAFDAAPYLPRGVVLYVVAALAIVGTASRLNAYVMDLFEVISIFDTEGVTPTTSSTVSVDANYQLILAFIGTAIVPAFVEEALFRGTVLKNLLPFGRTTAVFISALLFGMMHQNAAQFFYTTVAGLAIGYIYVHTKSIWCCVLIHFCNNALSVFTAELYNRMPLRDALVADMLCYLVLALLGVVAALLLLHQQRNQTDDLLQNGCFERTLAPDAEYAAEPLPLSRRIKLFCTPPMLIFLVLCAVQVLYMLGMAVLY